jgi:ABC-2 type transport system ATP-binding protein
MRRIAVVFGQRTDLWWDHSVLASYRWKRAVWDIPVETYREMLEFVIDLFALDDLLEAPVRELSLGQRMRADLGFALLHNPELLLLDEPTLGLDVSVKARLIDALRQLNHDSGMTILATSHDIDDLEALAGRILLLNRGSLEFDGSFRELRKSAGAKTYLSFHSVLNPELPVGARVDRAGTEYTLSFDADDHESIIGALIRAQEVALPGTLRVWEQATSDVVLDLYRAWDGRQMDRKIQAIRRATKGVGL